MKPIVIYHYPCLDGFTAAWACWLKHPDWEFYPAIHGDPMPDVTGRDVYLLDFSYKKPIMEEILAKSSGKVVVLDHHVSAQKELMSLLEDQKILGQFDMSHSGAWLSWNYFHSTPAPMFVKLVEDRDLWKWAIPESRNANAVFFSYDYDFQTWSDLHAKCENPEQFAIVMMEGAAIERKHHKDVAELVARTKRKIVIDGVSVWAANLPYTLVSDAGHLLAKDEPFAAVYFQTASGFEFSLRSTDTGSDVSEIAKKYGGGGHKNAAGFRIPNLESL